MVPFPAGPRDFSLMKCVKTYREVQTVCYSLGTGSGLEAGHYIQLIINYKVSFC